jgi:pyruvate dehydrogenase E1 component beta subunit
MAKTTYREALRAAMSEAMRADPRVFLMGEDVGRYGGAFAVSMGMLEEFGPERIRDTPLAESTFVGAGIGAAVGGLRPIVEIMTINFSLLAFDQIVNTAATLRHMSGGQFNVPLVVRMTSGAGRGVAAQHSHSFEGWYAHVPGIKVVTPGTVADAKGLLFAALADPDPVFIMEHGTLYPMEGDDADDVPMEIGRAALRRTGNDVSIITYGGSVPKAMAAAGMLASQRIEADVLDLRSLRPLDRAAILASVEKTHRAVIVDEMWLTGSFAGEISAIIMEQAFDALDAPVMRVASAEVPIPYAKHLEDAALPSAARIVATVRALLGRA